MLRLIVTEINTYTWPELATEGESWGRWIATYSNEVSQQISNKV